MRKTEFRGQSWTCVASFALAVPIVVNFIRAFLSSFQQTPDFLVSLNVVSLAGTGFLTSITVLTHCRRAAARHPVHTLGYE
jgi:hypothetical protein